MHSSLTKRLRRPLVALLAASSLAVPLPAFALQPLSTFLTAASQRNPQAIAADATIRQRHADAKTQLAKMLPAFSAKGIFTHNQYEAAVTLAGVGTLTIQPQNQLDAYFTLDVPLIDLAQFARYDSAKLQRELAEASRDLTDRQLSERVIRAYYTLLGSSALVGSANKTVEASQANLDVVKERHEAGVASDLDLQRAIANLEQSHEDVADAKLSETLAVRSLETLSRVHPDVATTFPTDDLHAEAPLDQWIAFGQNEIPEMRVARMQVEVADENVKAAERTYLPSLAAQGQERLTNATGFVGHAAYYLATATLSWRFDLATVSQKEANDAAADVQRANAEGTRRDAEDAIVDAWSRVEANIVKARSSRAQVTATNAASKLALDRYASGVANQLDVTQAQRDDFAADVTRIQADLDLAQSRAVLRLASGASPLDHSSVPTHPAPAERAHP